MSEARKMIKIICPGCKAFMAYIPAESDLYCSTCSKWIYLGLGGGKGKQEAKKPKGK